MLVVYKGYEKEFLEREKDKRLVDTEIENKINISIKFQKKLWRQLHKIIQDL